MAKDKILVVDDEQLIFDSIENTLGNEYQLYHAENGEVGLKLHAEQQPIIIILDIRMPVMDGFEFLQQIGISADDPYSVIVLSGHAAGPEVRSCYNMGVTAFLRKPFNVFELRGLVKQCISAKKHYQALFQRERYIRAILEHSIDMIIALNSGLNIIEFNPAAENSFGCKALDVQGTPFKDLFADTMQFNAVETSLSSGKTFSGEVSLLRKTGESFPAFLNLAVLRDASGNTIGTVGEIQVLDVGESPVGAVGGVRDMTIEKQLADLQREKRDIEVLKVSVETMKDKVRNNLNGLMLLRLQVNDIPTFDEQAKTIFDTSVKDMTSFLNKLSNMETFSTITFGSSTVFDIDGRFNKKDKQ